MFPAIRLLAFAVLALTALLAGCGRLPTPEQSGELVVGIRETPGFFQRSANPVESDSGAEYDLIKAFADHLRLKPRFVVASAPAELNELLARGKIHVAAAVPLATGDGVFSGPVRRMNQVIVGTIDGFGPEDLSELPEHEVLVVAGSPMADVLRGLPQPPQVIEVPDSDEAGLLDKVARTPGTLAAVHEVDLDLAINVLPDLRPLLRLPDPLELGWAFAGQAAPALKAKADEFLAQARRDGTLARINDRHFGHLRRITYVGIAQFIEDIRNRLPDYRRDFQAAGEITGIDWRLLAALAYHESKWDPLATSYTNVRGMMMLTEDTADHLGVKNRLDPRESIRAGSRYLLELVEQVPETTPFPDRLWLGLAAYNLGMGHLRGGIAVAKGLKRDPDSWYEMKQVLPLLSRPEVYARLKSGRARGGEAVIMVENIRTYFDILARLEAPQTTPFPKFPPGQGFKLR